MSTNNAWNNQVLDANVTLNGGQVDIGTDASDNAINIGTAALLARTITIGNSSGSTDVNLISGTDGISLTSFGLGNIVIDSNGTCLLDSLDELQINSAAAISIGNDAVAQAINIGTGAAARPISIGNATGATAVTITSGTGSVALVSTGSGDITLDSDDALLLDADAELQLNSSGGAISIGSDADSQAINIGTAGTRTVTVGNTSSSSALNLRSGTGNISLQSSSTGDITIDSDDILTLDSDGVLELNSSAGAISIGNDSINQAINVGTAGARTITVGNTSSSSALNLRSGTGSISLLSNSTGDITIDSDDTLLLDSDGVLELNSSAGEISIGNDDIDSAINIGTAGERAVNIGSTQDPNGGGVCVNVGTLDFKVYGVEEATNVVIARDSGEISFPRQPCFLAYNSADNTNVTGNGTTFTIEFDTTIFNITSSYSTTTDTFTAPKDGRYYLSFIARASDITAGMDDIVCSIVTTDHTFFGTRLSPIACESGSGYVTFGVSVICRLGTADTAFCQVTISGGAGDTADISGGASLVTYFNGRMVQ